jgi:protein phosphatase
MGDTTPTTRPALAWGVSTDPGRVREDNEDSYVAEPMVLGIADGMGGHQAGEVASQLAVDILRERLGGGAANLDVVVAAVAEANAAIFQAAHANADQRGMGTTLTAIALVRDIDDDQFGADAEQLVLVNVGDSRAYVHRDGVLRRASIDHSYVQELVATGHITEAEARTHPRRNIVTRALGIEPQVRVDTWTQRLVRGDRYELCSDGLVDEVDDTEIQDVANRFDDPQDAADELVALANVHGGRDNVTVIVADVLAGADPDFMNEPHQPAEEPDGEGGPELVDATPVPTVDLDDPAASASTTMVVTAEPAPRKRRRMTLRLFLVLLAAAIVLTVGVVLIAVAAGGDDKPAPTTSTSTTTTLAPTTTVAPTTAAPTTAAPTTTIAGVTTSAAGG